MTLIAILAGGRARRLGGRKADVTLCGKALIEYPLAAARAAAALSGSHGSRSHQVVVVAKSETPLPELGVRLVEEPSGQFHPLLGIVTALREADGPVVVVGCDMPFVNGQLLAWIASLPDTVAVPRVSGRLHPLLARYGPELLEPLERALVAEVSLHERVAAHAPREIRELELKRFGDPRRLLFNVNTPSDLRAAEKVLEYGGAAE